MYTSQHHPVELVLQTPVVENEMLVVETGVAVVEKEMLVVKYGVAVVEERDSLRFTRLDAPAVSATFEVLINIISHHTQFM